MVLWTCKRKVKTTKQNWQILLQCLMFAAKLIRILVFSIYQHLPIKTVGENINTNGLNAASHIKRTNRLQLANTSSAR